MKAQKRLFVVVGLLMMGTLACSLVDKAVSQATGGGDLQTTSSLWRDVPAMDGLEKSDMDMPLPVKLLVNSILGNLGQLNPEGMDQSIGKVDWIVFTSDRTPADVQEFYTPARMSEQGWEGSDGSTCLSGSEQGIEQIGMVCLFSKQGDGMMTQLVILAAPDEQAKKLNVFFLRMEVQPTPVPNP